MTMTEVEKTNKKASEVGPSFGNDGRTLSTNKGRNESKHHCLLLLWSMPGLRPGIQPLVCVHQEKITTKFP